VQAFGNRLARGFDPGAAQGGKLLWIAFSSQDRFDSAQTTFSRNVADNIAQLHKLS
jgi:hypothetical protein